jgi:hypothetical protein
MSSLRKLIVSCLAAAALAALPVTASKAQAQTHRAPHARAGHHHARAYAVYYRLTPTHAWVWYLTYPDERQAITAAFNLRARYPTAHVLIRPVR